MKLDDSEERELEEAAKAVAHFEIELVLAKNREREICARIMLKQRQMTVTQASQIMKALNESR